MQRRHALLLSALLLLTTGCDDGPAPEPACALTAAPAAQPVGGDANGDGFVDVSDGMYLARAALAGGPAPVCDAAIDLVPNGSFDLGDIPALFYSVGPKTAPYRPDASGCAATERTVEPPCGDGLAMGLAVSAGTATVSITTADLPVEAWSFTLTAQGCTIESGTTAGTAAADQADGTGGLRANGVAWQSVTASEARVLTVLDWRTQATLPTGTQAVHTFTLGGCGTCTLTLVPGEAAGVESVVSVEGWRYVPELGSVSVELCGG